MVFSYIKNNTGVLFLGKEKKKSIFNAAKFAKEYKALLNQDDKDINLTDIPELDFDNLGKPVIGRFYRPIKKPISLRMDADVLEWFKSHTHYQKLINKACRLYMYIYQRRNRNHVNRKKSNS